LRRSGLSNAEITERIRDLLRLVSLQGFEMRRVQQLSGGEQQRVAIARALAPRPRILLLDEPLAALDEKIRREMQLELRSIQQRTGTTFIYVTHDQEEALTMSDRIAVLNRGECVQCDRPERIFRRPRTAFVARFFRGSNVVSGEASTPDGLTFLTLPGVAEPIPLSEPAPAGPIEVALRAERIALGPEAAARTIRFTAHLDSVVYRGVYSEYVLRLADGQTLAATLAHQPAIVPGHDVDVGFEPDDLVVLERG
jgi:ABC-type Fe3+/spermidine/putrescine transport system ATPase subunit